MTFIVSMPKNFIKWLGLIIVFSYLFSLVCHNYFDNSSTKTSSVYIVSIHFNCWATSSANLKLWCLFEKVRTHFAENPDCPPRLRSGGTLGRGGIPPIPPFRRARAFRRSEAEAVIHPDSFGKKFGFHSGGTARLC